MRPLWYIYAYLLVIAKNVLNLECRRARRREQHRITRDRERLLRKQMRERVREDVLRNRENICMQRRRAASYSNYKSSYSKYTSRHTSRFCTILRTNQSRHSSFFSLMILPSSERCVHSMTAFLV